VPKKYLDRSRQARFTISSVEKPELFKSLINIKKKIIECPKHGKTNNWILGKKKRGPRLNYKPIRKKSYIDYFLACPLCNREYDSKLIRSNVPYYLFSQCKKRAKRQNFKFDLKKGDIENLFKKQNHKCSYTKLPFDEETISIYRGKKGIRFFSSSIDRIDSKKGYTKSNIEIVLTIINLMKSDLTKLEFIRVCKSILKPIKNKGSLELLKYAWRSKPLNEQVEDKKRFYKGQKILCYAHGYHKDFIIKTSLGIHQSKTPGSIFERKFKYPKCKKCYKFKGGYKMRTREEVNKDIKKFEQNKKIFCKVHGYHKDFVLYEDKKNKNIRCRICFRLMDKNARKKHLFSNLYTQAKNRATSDISYTDLINLFIKQNGKCFYSNQTFDNDKNVPSIDKINPKLGYTKKNICLSTFLINRTKWDLNIKEFRRLTGLAVKNFR